MSTSQKRSRAALVDTSVLPVYGGLDGPLWLSVRKLAEHAQVELLMPDLAVRESVNLRRIKYEAASANFLGAYTSLEKYADVQPIYIPAPDEVLASWEDELREVFKIIPLDGADAVAALEREAHRVPPAREGRGARDSAIWLTALRLAGCYETLFFLSANTADFGVRKTTDLHPDLAVEVANASLPIVFLTGAEPFIGRLAATATIEPPDATVLAGVLQLDLHQALVHANDSLNQPLLDPDTLPLEAIHLTRAEVRRGFDVEDLRLALVDLHGHVDVVRSAQVEFNAKAWVELDRGGYVAGSEVQSAEIQQVQDET